MRARIRWARVEPLLQRSLQNVSVEAASQAALELNGLARWCLRPEVLALAAKDDTVPDAFRASWRQSCSTLPVSPGACWVVFATGGPVQYPLLRNAFVLPLQWRIGLRHHAGLPEKLKALAEEVCQIVLPKSSGASPNWGLQWPSELEALNAQELPLDCDSGWASLAAGLIVAAQGGVPKPSVWASGAWHPGDGIRRVDQLDAKIKLATECGVREFFVPQSQLEEVAQATSGTGVTVRPLYESRLPSSEALSDYLFALESPPEFNGSTTRFEQCRDYYLRILDQHPEIAEVYYRDHLIPYLTAELRKQVQSRYPDLFRPHVALWVSTTNLVRLIVKGLGACRCLLLYSDDEEHLRQASQLRDEFTEENISCTTAPIVNSSDGLADVRNCLRAWAGTIPHHQIVFDVTTGNKRMSLMLLRAAFRDSHLFYLAHETTNRNRPTPGTEVPELWRAAEMNDS